MYPGTESAATELLRSMIERHASAEDPVKTLAEGLASFNEMFRLTPEWRTRAEDVEIVGSKGVPTPAGCRALAYMSGKHVLALDDQILAGIWGEPGNPGRLTPRGDLSSSCGCR